ncbi:hypothetical protein ABZ215_25240, partial [Amycolatopsis sp. NPDC006131]
MAEYVLSAEITPVLSRNFTSSAKSQITKALAGVNSQVRITGKFDGAAARTDLRKFINTSRSDIKLKGVFDDTGLAAKVKAAAARAGADVKVGVNLDKGLVESQLRELQRNRSTTIRVGADTSSAQASISRLQAMAAGVFVAIGVGASALPSLLAGVSGGLGAIGGSAVGVAKALSAYKDEQNEAAQSAGSSASQFLSQAIAMRNAQQAVDDARRNAARVAEQSARQISDAQANVVSAERDVAEAQREAVRAEQAIHRARQQALRDLQDLQEAVDDYALSQEEASIALARAQQNLDDVNNSGTASALDRRDAELALAQARERLEKVTNDASSTDLDREVAALNVAQAQQHLADVTKEAARADLDRREAALEVAQAQERLSDLARDQTRNVEDLNAAQAAGVDGSEQVVSAREAERTANLRVQSAQEALQKAQLDLSRTQQDAAAAQEDASIQVARALQGVADAQARAGASAASATKDTDKFAEAMAKLSPVGQQFVNQILSMGTAWDRFQKATQTATLPGLTDFLSSLASIESPATRGITTIGREISDLGFKAAELNRNPLFQGNLEATFKNAAPVVEAFGDGMLRVTERLVRFGAENSQLAGSTARLVSDLFDSVSAYYDGLQPHVAGVSRLLEGLGTITKDVSGGLGTLFGQFAGAYAQNATNFEQTFSDLLDTFLQLTAAGLPALTNGLSILADALQLANTVIQPFTSFLGGLGGNVIAGVLALKLLSGAANGVASAFTALNPAGVAKRIEGSKLGQAIGGVGAAANAADGTTNRFSGTLGKVGSAAVSAAKYIPLVGVALAAGQAAFSSFAPSLDDLATKYLQGGNAAQEAADKTYQLTDGWSNGGPAGFFFRDTLEEVRAKAMDLYRAMDPLERKQTDVTRAQNDMNRAINTYGPQSEQARLATSIYANEVRNLKDRQWEAEQATKTHTEKIRDQRQAMLDQANGVVSYNSAMLQVQTAQQNLDAAVRQYGAGSLQAQQAQNQLEQAMLGTITAATQLSDAQTAGLPPSIQTAAQTEAINRQLAILSQQAGGTLPPALQTMVNGLKDSDVAAFGARVSTDGLGNSIIMLPDGKTLTFPTNADDTKKRVDDLAASVWKVSGAYADWWNNYQKFLTAPPPAQVPGAPPLPLHNAAGGLIAGPGTGTSDSILSWLSNGEYVINAKATAKFLPLLEAINANRYATGGLVGFADGGTATASTSGAAVAAPGGVTFTIPDLTEPTEQVKALTEAAAALSGMVNGTLVPALLAQAVMQDSQLIPSLAALELHLSQFMPNANNTLLASTWALHGGVTAAWLGMQNSVWGSTNAQIGAFNSLNTGLAGVRDAMSFTAEWAVTQYGRVWAAAADPIRAVLHGPINAGLIAAWNSLNAQFALNRPVAPVGVPFATGGYVSGPGSSTSDSIQARLSNGEYVIPAAITKKVRPFLDALRAGEGEAMQAAGYLPGYAQGGIVANTGSQLNAVTARVVGFLNQQKGKPYIWGGVGPVGFDCSGLVSAATNVARGEANPYRRLGVAASQPWPGFVRGLSSAFATGYNSHHTAMTVAGAERRGVGAAGDPRCDAGGGGDLADRGERRVAR